MPLTKNQKKIMKVINEFVSKISREEIIELESQMTLFDYYDEDDINADDNGHYINIQGFIEHLKLALLFAEERREILSEIDQIRAELAISKSSNLKIAYDSKAGRTL